MGKKGLFGHGTGHGASCPEERAVGVPASAEMKVIPQRTSQERDVGRSNGSIFQVG